MKFVLAVAFALVSICASATDYFVYDTITSVPECAQGLCWGHPYITIYRDWSSLTAADTVYVHSAHAADTAGSQSLTGPSASTDSAKVTIHCVAGNTTGTTPGALCADSTASDKSTNGQVGIYGAVYIWGVDIGGGSGSRVEFGANSDIDIFLENLDIIGDGATSILHNGSSTVVQGLRFRDVTVTSNNAGLGFWFDTYGGGAFRWEGGAITGTAINLLFQSGRDQQQIQAYISGVDLSQVDKFIDESEWIAGSFLRIDSCKLQAGFVNGDFIDAALSGEGTETRISVVSSEPGTPANPSIQRYGETRHGFFSTDTARYRTDGYTDGDTSASWSLDTGSNTFVQEIYDPYIADAVGVWVTAGATTVRFYGADASLPDDDEFGVRCLIPNQSDDSPQKEWITSRPDPLATPAALTADEQATNGSFATDTGWTKGAGWTISGGTATHSGGAGDLEQNAADVITNGLTYEVVYTVSGRTAGTIFTRIAGTAGTSRSTNATFTEALAAGSGSAPKIEFVADASFDGSIDDVSVHSEWAGTDVGSPFWIDMTATPIQDGLWTCWPWIGVDAARISFDHIVKVQ